MVQTLGHKKLLVTEKCDDGVRSLLDSFDEIRVDGDGLAVETMELDHGQLLPTEEWNVAE